MRPDTQDRIEHAIKKLGYTPNLAARLQSLAAPNTVIVSDNTRTLLRDAFDYRSLGEHVLKGFDEPVVIHVMTEKGRGYAPAENDHVKRLHDMGAPKPDSYTAAFTAPGDHVGCTCFTRAATPAAWGEDIEVPLR